MPALAPISGAPLGSLVDASEPESSASDGGMMLGFGPISGAPISSAEGSEAAPGSPTLTASPGTVEVAGAAANLRRSYSMSAVRGEIELNGRDLTASIVRILAADPGSLILNGQNAALVRAAILGANPRSVVLEGRNADLMLVIGGMDADAGAISLLGRDAEFLRSYALAALSGDIDISGSAASLSAGGVFLVAALPGTIDLQGKAASLTHVQATFIFEATPGQIVLVGSPATFVAPTVDTDAVLLINGVSFPLIDWGGDYLDNDHQKEADDGTVSGSRHGTEADGVYDTRIWRRTAVIGRLSWETAQTLLANLQTTGKITLAGSAPDGARTVILSGGVDIEAQRGDGHSVFVTVTFEEVKA